MMTVRLFGIALSVCLISFCVRADLRTWSGGGSDANWSTTANWGGNRIELNGNTDLRLQNSCSPSAGTLIRKRQLM